MNKPPEQGRRGFGVTNLGDVENQYNIAGPATFLQIAATKEQAELLLAALGWTPADLARSSGMGGALSRAEPPPDLSPPVPTSSLAPRAATVARLQATLTECAWMALHGHTGSGKSELALLLHSAASSVSRWLQLRDLVDEQLAHARLRAALSAIAAAPAVGGQPAWHDLIAVTLGKGSLFVIDDLPQFDSEGPLGKELTSLALAFERSGANLITTGALRPPAKTVKRVGNSIRCVEAPPFSDDEVSGLLVAYGAPSHWRTPAHSKLINSLCHGHPELLLTAILFLKEQEWPESADVLESLLKNEHLAPSLTDVIRRVQATVKHDGARSLLYRMAVIIGEFSADDARAIALPAPVIPEPSTALSRLEGLWIQPRRGSRFLACPLIKGLERELEPETIREVRRVLGNRILEQGQVSPVEIQIAIAHLTQAEDYERVGATYCLALDSLDASEGDIYDAGLSDLWSAAPLPERMGRGLMIYVRTLQVRARQRMRKASGFIISDLFLLAEKVPQGDSRQLLPLVTCLEELSVRDFARTNALLLRVLLEVSRSDTGPPEGDEGHSRDLVYAFLWHQTAYIRDIPDARVWLTSLAVLSPEVRQQAAQGQSYDGGCRGVCDRIWMSEADKPRSDQDWASIEAVLREVEGVGEALNLKLLWAFARRARLVVAGEYTSRFEDAVRMAQDALAREPTEPRMTFLFKECLGRLFVYKERWAEAARYLGEALGQRDGKDDVSAFYAQMYLSVAVGHSDSQDAAAISLGASQFALEIQGLPHQEVVKSLGELAIALWLSQGIDAAFAPVERAARLLFEIKDQTEGWRDLFVIFGHVLGYFAYSAQHGRPPEQIDDTGEPYAPPPRGLFLRQHRGRHRLYREEAERQFKALLAFYSDVVGDDRAAVSWAREARGVRNDAEDFILFLLDSLLVSDDVANGGVMEALQAASSSGQTPRVAEFICIAVVTSLARTAIRSMEEGKARACEVVEFLRGPGAMSEQAQLWDGLAFVIELSFGEGDAATRLVEFSREPSTGSGLMVAARLGASLRRERPFAQALADHVALSSFLLERIPMFRPFYRRLYLPLLHEFWLSAVDRASFHFSAPSFARSRIDATTEVPPRHRAQRLLSVVADALGMRPPSEIKLWFASGADVSA